MLDAYVMLKSAARVAGIAAILSVAACANPPSNDRTDIRDAGDDFPALDDNWDDGGRFVDPQNILSVQQGQTKDQVRALLGNPQFSEGFFAVHEWNYVFNLHTDETRSDYITCQYQVTFDDDMVVENSRWRDAQCPELLVPTVIPEEPEAEQPVPLVLSGDVMFDYDSDQLTLEGQHALDRVAASMQAEFVSPAVVIEGYTDHFGSESYNQALSQSRAQAVSDYLESKGINAANITAIGRGAANPVVECDGRVATNAVKACLQPNRRVELTVSEAE